MKGKGFILGLSVLLISNVTLFMGVAANSSGGPVQTIELSEMELPMMPRGPEDTSVGLQIAWRPLQGSMSIPRPARERGVIFDREKLLSMGFRLGTADSRNPQFRAPQRRLLYVALEYAAAASGTPSGAAAQAQSDTHPPAALPAVVSGSRLKAVDAAASFEQLRARYPDQRRHVVVRGVVDAWAEDDPSRAAVPRWEGYVAMIVPSQIQVPLPFSKAIGGERGGEQHYSVTLHYGRNLEPWVGSIQRSHELHE